MKDIKQCLNMKLAGAVRKCAVLVVAVFSVCSGDLKFGYSTSFSSESSSSSNEICF